MWTQVFLIRNFYLLRSWIVERENEVCENFTFVSLFAAMLTALTSSWEKSTLKSLTNLPCEFSVKVIILLKKIIFQKIFVFAFFSVLIDELFRLSEKNKTSQIFAHKKLKMKKHFYHSLLTFHDNYGLLRRIQRVNSEIGLRWLLTSHPGRTG